MNREEEKKKNEMGRENQDQNRKVIIEEERK